jgi:hypothetical protein
MATRNTHLWRGNIRGRTRGLSARASSLLKYGEKHQTPAFLDQEEVDTLRAVIQLCDRILSDTVFPPAAPLSSRKDTTPPTVVGDPE